MTGQEINASVLDAIAGEVTGFKTSYFTKNIHDDTAAHPFLIEDPREIKFDGASYCRYPNHIEGWKDTLSCKEKF